MKTYKVVITETLQRTAYIDAKSAEERYNNEEIVLDWGGYQDTKIEVAEDDN